MANALDITDGTEDGQLDFKVLNGSASTVATLDSTKLFLNAGTDITFEGDGADSSRININCCRWFRRDRTITANATGTVAVEEQLHLVQQVLQQI